MLVEAIKESLLVAAKKSIGTSSDVRVEVDPRTCEINVFQTLVVSDDVHGTGFIPVRKAQEYKPNAKPGDCIEIPAHTRDFGRIAAQTARQTVMQKIRQIENENTRKLFENRLNTIMIGTIKQIVHGDYIVDIGESEAILPVKEQVRTEVYNVGDTIRALLVRVADGGNLTSGPGLVLSRKTLEFVRALFVMEVTEISDGVVEIMSIARDEGFRTKIAVRACDSKVDAVGACVGMRGARVKNIVRELNGEKIDVVRWNPDLITFAREAMQPVECLSITVETDEEGRKELNIVVADKDYTLAIGKKGKNAKLVSYIVGHNVKITKPIPEKTNEQKMADFREDLLQLDGIDDDVVDALVAHGFLTMEGIGRYDTAEEFLSAAAEVQTGSDEVLPVELLERAWTAVKQNMAD